MGSGDGKASLPPLIDFGEEDDNATSFLAGSHGSVPIFSSSTCDPFAECMSPAGSSSSPGHFEQWNASRASSVMENSFMDQWDETPFASYRTDMDTTNKVNTSFDSTSSPNSMTRFSRHFREDMDFLPGNSFSSEARPQLDLLSSPDVSTHRQNEGSEDSPYVSPWANQTSPSDTLPLKALESMALHTMHEGKDLNFNELDFRDESSGSHNNVSFDSLPSGSQSFSNLNPHISQDANDDSWLSPLSQQEPKAGNSIQIPSDQTNLENVDWLGDVNFGKACGGFGPTNADMWRQSHTNNDMVEASCKHNRVSCDEYGWPSQHEDNKVNNCQRSKGFLSKGQESMQTQQESAVKANGARAGQLKEFESGGSRKGMPKTYDQDEDAPIAFELRPQPFKVSPIQPTGELVCTDDSLWLACEQGFLVWDIPSALKSSCDGRENFIGDEDAAAYSKLMHGFSTTCLFADTTNNLVWSGHEDGKARAWHISFEHYSENANSGTAAIFAWQAHQTPVLAMAISSYGEIWTGSECGSLRVWSQSALAQAFSSSKDSRLVAACFLATSYIDLKARGLSSGATCLTTIDMRFLVAENSQCRVWSGGSHLLVLWDARTKELLKVVSSNADPEFLSPNVSPVRDIEKGEEGNMAKVLKKEKSQGALSFFQRSRNAVIGAADAVLRAAVGQSIDDSKRMEALVSASDGNVWVGYANGRLAQWDSSGCLLADYRYSSTGVRCMLSFGNRIFVGYVDGVVHALAMTSGKLVGAWCAHGSSIVRLGVSNNHLFTLTDNGCIRGWFIRPHSNFTKALRHTMKAKESTYLRQEKLKVLAGTWNVGQEKACPKSLKSWLARGSMEASIVAIGLQEVEMGAGALAMAAAKETVGLAGSSNGQWWLDSIEEVLNEKKQFARIGSRQLAGLLIGVWVTKDLVPHIGDVDVSAVACGFGRAFGNKGAVAVRMLVFRRTISVVNCHFAAHVDGVARRNADFDHIYRRISFGRSFGTGSGSQVLRGNYQDVFTSEQGDRFQEKDHDSGDANVNTSELHEADLLIWMGDLNYRLADVSYMEAVSLAHSNKWGELLRKDQLRLEIKAGRVFQGMREAYIMFQPTYKFDKGSIEFDYDSSDKRRVPAWCDRVLYRDSFDSDDAVQKLSCAQPVAAAACRYQACMEAFESDHKPVSCLLETQVAVIVEAARRWEYGRFMRTDSDALLLQRQINTIPQICVHSDNIVLVNKAKSILKLTNESTEEAALFGIQEEGELLGSISNNQMLDKRGADMKGNGLPFWLQVLPSSGLIYPQQTAEVALQCTLFEESSRSKGSSHSRQNRRDTVLVVNVKGVSSSTSTEQRVKISH